MNALRGFIPIKGKIEGFGFIQTLVPVRHEPYRLFVNGMMLKGSNTKPGDLVRFQIEEDPSPRTASTYPFPRALRKKLRDNNLEARFNSLSDSRRKEILRYLDHLKTEEALLRNIEKIVNQMNSKRKK